MTEKGQKGSVLNKLPPLLPLRITTIADPQIHSVAWIPNPERTWPEAVAQPFANCLSLYPWRMKEH